MSEHTRRVLDVRTIGLLPGVYTVVDSRTNMTEDEDNNNVALIRAAPALLEALESLDAEELSIGACRKVSAAIAKATANE